MKAFQLLLHIVCSVSLFAGTDSDSSRVYRLDDVTVTSTRFPVPANRFVLPIRSVDSMAMAQSNGTTAADKIATLPGVSVRSYGGNGALSSMSLRGLGPEYTLILVDGQRYTTFQNGTVDLGLIDAGDVERIDVMPGGSSAQFGADAVGGVINIVSKQPSPEPFATVELSAGSNGLFSYALSGGTGNGSTAVRASIGGRHARNDFRFLYNDGSGAIPLLRNGADHSSRTGSVAVRYSPSTDRIHDLSVRYADADRGQPDAVTSTVQSSGARIRDTDISGRFGTDIVFAEAWNISAPLALRSQRQRFIDPTGTILGSIGEARYDNLLVTAAPAVRYSDHTTTDLLFVADLAYGSISSTEVASAHRRQAGFSVSSHHHVDGTISADLFPSMRYDLFSDVPSALSPRIGLSAGWDGIIGVNLRVAAGKNYRVPTFNDLYWIGSGNTSLRPERSEDANAGLTIRYRDDVISVRGEADLYLIEAKDKIIWLPVSSTVWSPRNLSSVRSRGAELRLNAQLWNGAFVVDLSRTMTDVRKTSSDGPADRTADAILPYVPQQGAVAAVGTSFEGLSASVLYHFTGFRYITSDNDPRFILPSVGTVDANISYRFAFGPSRIRLRLECSNLSDQSYQWIAGYPVPLRQFLLSTSFLF